MLQIAAILFLCLWVGCILVGALLIVLAKRALPKGIPMYACPPEERVNAGVYYYLRHPMYLGNTLLITGIVGLGSGVVTAFGVGLLCLTVFGEWAAIENDEA